MTPSTNGAYGPDDAAQVVLGTRCDGCPTCQGRAREVAHAYLDLRAQVTAVLGWVAETGCTCPGDFVYASLPDHELDCPAQVEHLLTTDARPDPAASGGAS